MNCLQFFLYIIQIIAKDFVKAFMRREIQSVSKLKVNIVSHADAFHKAV